MINLCLHLTSLMFQSGLPLKFWPYSILTATWLIKRTLSEVLEWATPFEILFGHSTDYRALKPFGCLAFTANISPTRGKFNIRSLKCVFLGFDSCHKGYVLYDLDNGNILISRDVNFIRHTFPFLSPTPTVNDEPSLSLPAVPITPGIDTPIDESNPTWISHRMIFSFPSFGFHLPIWMNLCQHLTSLRVIHHLEEVLESSNSLLG